MGKEFDAVLQSNFKQFSTRMYFINLRTVIVFVNYYKLINCE